MPETTVLCGGVSFAGVAASILKLDVDAPEGSPERLNLNIGHITRPMVSSPPDRLVDLLEIACYVYSADQFVHRGGEVMAGMGRYWRRDLRFFIPVRDVAFWHQQAISQQLIETLTFLSDDDYEFVFVAAEKPRAFASYLDLQGDGAPVGFVPDRIALFSGGLDSLAGAATALLQRNESVALVSHQASSMVQARQAELVQSLRTKATPGHLFHTGVTVTKGQDEAREFTQRTRSFLFASLAFVIARLFGKQEITFYENGIVSVNLPISEHILGSRATRTTHPKVLVDFAKLFSRIAGTDIRLVNPLFWSTKAEVVNQLADAGCADLMARSFSCSHVRLATRTGQQCGICTQCLDRRFAVLASGMEKYDPADGYQVDLLTGERTAGPELTVAESYVLSALRYEAMTEAAFFSRHGQAFRALPYLDGRIEENAARLHDLHTRHGRAVRRVIDAAFRGTTIDAALSLPPTCLLSLLRAPFGSPAVSTDAVEREPPVAQQAEALSGPEPVERPIVVAVDWGEKRIELAGQVILTGASYHFLAQLLPTFLEDIAAGTTPEAFRFTQTHKLAKALGKEEQTIRQRVLRLRKNIAAAFLARANAVVSSDDIVQNLGRGYRLNPHLAVQSALAGNDSRP